MPRLLSIAHPLVVLSNSDVSLKWEEQSLILEFDIFGVDQYLRIQVLHHIVSVCLLW